MRQRLALDNRRLRSVLVAVGLVAEALIMTELILRGPKGASGRGTAAAILFQSAINGLLTGLVAASIVLVYRTQRFINFAAAGLGGGGAVLVYGLIRLTHAPFLVALVGGLALGAASGAVFEV